MTSIGNPDDILFEHILARKPEIAGQLIPRTGPEPTWKDITMPRLEKTRSVLHFRSQIGQTVRFGRPDDERGTILSALDWRDLGEPKEITVTIEPGDRLNEYHADGSGDKVDRP